MMASNWSRKLHRMKWTILLWVLQYIPVPKMHHTTTTTLLLYCSQFFDPFITRTIGQWFHCSNAEYFICAYVHTYMYMYVLYLSCVCAYLHYICTRTCMWFTNINYAMALWYMVKNDFLAVDDYILHYTHTVCDLIAMALWCGQKWIFYRM